MSTTLCFPCPGLLSKTMPIPALHIHDRKAEHKSEAQGHLKVLYSLTSGVCRPLNGSEQVWQDSQLQPKFIGGVDMPNLIFYPLCVRDMTKLQDMQCLAVPLKLRELYGNNQGQNSS